MIEENKTYTLYNYHVFDNDIAFNPFKVVFGSGTKVLKYDKLTNVLTHEFRFKSFKEIQDGKFKTGVLNGIVMCFNLFLIFSDYNVLIDVIFFKKSSGIFMRLSRQRQLGLERNRV